MGQRRHPTAGRDDSCSCCDIDGFGWWPIELYHLCRQKGKQLHLVYRVAKEIRPIVGQFGVTRHFLAHTMASLFPGRLLQTVWDVHIPDNIQSWQCGTVWPAVYSYADPRW